MGSTRSRQGSRSNAHSTTLSKVKRDLAFGVSGGNSRNAYRVTERGDKLTPKQQKRIRLKANRGKRRDR